MASTRARRAAARVGVVPVEVAAGRGVGLALGAGVGRGAGDGVAVGEGASAVGAAEPPSPDGAAAGAAVERSAAMADCISRIWKPCCSTCPVSRAICVSSASTRAVRSTSGPPVVTGAGVVPGGCASGWNRPDSAPGNTRRCTARNSRSRRSTRRAVSTSPLSCATIGAGISSKAIAPTEAMIIPREIVIPVPALGPWPGRYWSN